MPSETSDILFVTRKWAPAMGGMETWSHKLSEELAKHIAVDVVALPGNTDGSPPSAARLLWFPITFLVRLLRRKVRPKALLVGDMALWPLALLGRIFARPKTTFIAAHGTDVSYHRRGGTLGYLYGLYLKIGSAACGSAMVIANSHATAAVAAETGWTDSTVIPLATEPFGKAANTKHNGSLLFAGRLVSLKGCGWFVREVLPKLPEHFRLKIAGTRWDKAENFVLDHPRVEHLGLLNREELVIAYNSAMCTILPNIVPGNGQFEGFGLVAAEAAAAGGVVLAANIDGLTDALINHETGLLVESGSAEAWIAAITQVAEWTEQQRSSFTESAQAKALGHYSWDRVAKQVLALMAVPS